VEDSFQARLASFATRAADTVQQAPAESEQPSERHRPDPSEREKRPRSRMIDKSMLALPEPRRVRDREHVKSVTKQPCLICGRQPSDAHHLRFAQHRALGRKVSDEFTVPLCRGQHREVHRCGDESAWWKKPLELIQPSRPTRCGCKPIRYRRRQPRLATNKPNCMLTRSSGRGELRA
jgi:hypothetical protein